MGFLGSAAGGALAVLIATAALAQDPTGTAAAAPAGAPAGELAGQRLDVVPNANETVAEGVLSGFATVRYLVDAGAGQELRVSLEADNPQTAFNVLAPDAATPLFNGARKGRSFGQPLSASGSYAIEVYLSRAAARRSEAASYTLTVSVNGTTVPAAEAPARHLATDSLAGGPDYWEVTNLAAGETLAVRVEPGAGAAAAAEVAAGTLVANGGCRVVAGQRWCRVTGRDDPSVTGWVAGHNLREAVGVAASEPALPAASDAPAPALAVTEIACATAPAQPLAACGFTVDRVADGGAALRVALPGGGVRIIRFVNGEAVTSDGTGAFTASHDAGVSKIGIGDERFEIPDVVVRGG